MSNIVGEIVVAAGLEAPDGRPLYRYPVSPEQQRNLREAVRARFLAGSHELAAAAFVFWAAEHFRAKFPESNYRRWEFVFRGLGVPIEDSVGRSLVETGLKWWKRRVQMSDTGRQMFIYSLMAEGGLPQSLLAQEGLYRRVVLGLLADIEAEGGIHAAPFAERIAGRWITALPQTFQTEDFARLLAELGIVLARLRAALPEDLSGQAAEQWLDRHQPGWTAALPVRMSPEIAERLIRPALGATRERTVTSGPLAIRELRREKGGRWHWFLRLQEEGFLPGMLLPEAADLRLRLLPIGASATAEAPIYVATPDQGGWKIRRIGRAGVAVLPFEPDMPFMLGAFADGRQKGAIIVAPGMPDPTDAPSLWRAADPSDGPDTNRLVLQPGSGRARASCLWLLAPEAAEVIAEPGVALAPPEPVAGGRLWRISGQGEITVGARHRLRVETAAESEAAEALLVPIGGVLPRWRSEPGQGLIYLGIPLIFGEVGAAGLRPLSGWALRTRRSTSRILGEHIIEWIERDDVLARLRLICLPAAARLSVVETADGQVRLTAEGLPRGLKLTLRAGAAEARTDVTNGAAKLTLSIHGVPAGQLTLRLADVDAGTTLQLITPWPARLGLILDPDGNRLERDQPIAAEALRGWRAVVPEGASGDLALRLVGHLPVALAVAGEISLYPYVPLIRTMLAQGGPDAQVNLNLVVNGRDGRRLEVRRYHDHAVVDGDRLRAGLPRDTKVLPQNALAEQLDRRPLALHAVDLNAPAHPTALYVITTRNLRTLLGDSGGPWLIQSSLEGRVQRAVAWAPTLLPHSTREARISSYEDEWRRLLGTPGAPRWDRLWRLMVNVAQGGDGGVADQIQALARVSAAAVALALRVPREGLIDMLSLDLATPLFWPILPIKAFVQAVCIERKRRQQALLAAGFDSDEAEEEVDTALLRRIEAILTIRPELAGHFCAALFEAGLTKVAIGLARCGTVPFIANPAEQLKELAQLAARRFDRLPTGIGQIAPRQRPPGLVFGHYVQPVIDAPLAAAEIVAEWRAPASAREMLALINLRLVDPLYFDAALPAAVAFALQDTSR